MRRLLRRLRPRVSSQELVAALLAAAVALLAACHDRPDVPERSDPFERPGPSIKFYRHVLTARGVVVGEVVVIVIPQR